MVADAEIIQVRPKDALFRKILEQIEAGKQIPDEIEIPGHSRVEILAHLKMLAEENLFGEVPIHPYGYPYHFRMTPAARQRLERLRATTTLQGWIKARLREGLDEAGKSAVPSIIKYGGALAIDWMLHDLFGS